MHHAEPALLESHLAQLTPKIDYLFLALEECPPCIAAEAALGVLEAGEPEIRITKFLFDYKNIEHRAILRRINAGTLPRLIGHNGERTRQALLSVTGAVPTDLFAKQIETWMTSKIRGEA